MAGDSALCLDRISFAAVAGEIVKVTIIGSILTVCINGAQVIQDSDNKLTAGSPAMGYYLETGNTSRQCDHVFTSFCASATAGLGTVTQSLTIDWWQASIPGGISNRTSEFPCIVTYSEVTSTCTVP
jgi:hypothetical protein